MQKKSKETLLKILGNIGIIGAIIAAIADIIFVIIFVVGIKVEQNNTSAILFATVNAGIGTMISVLLRYQGQKYAEGENYELREKYFRKEIVEKKHLSLNAYNIVSAIKDIILKGGSTLFSIFGVIYISIEGSKNPIQILITIVTLLLFACFGLMNMNSSYCRYYNVEVPRMENELNKKEIK